MYFDCDMFQAMCWNFIFLSRALYQYASPVASHSCTQYHFSSITPVAVKVKQLDFAKQKFYKNVAKRKA